MSQPGEAGRVSTWELLPTLGFVEAAPGPYSVTPGLSFDFGNFTLTANALFNQYAQPVVIFDGILATPRTMAQVEFQLPQEVESADQALAMLAYYLDSASRNGPKLKLEPDWLVRGRANQHLLPWQQEREKERAAKAARPHCRVDRDWARVGLKKLAERLDSEPADARTLFSFDGSVLKIHCGEELIAMPAEGAAWLQSFAIPSASLRPMPSRLTGASVLFEVWDDSLVIGNRRYSGMSAAEAAT